jgi:protease I
MANQLQGKKIAILATDGFEQAELLEPQKALKDAGAEVDVITPSEGPAKPQSPDEIKGWNHTDWGRSVRIDRKLSDVEPEQYDALVLPGGVMNPDKLRQCSKAVAFVKAFVDAGKPIAAICHGPWTLIETGAVKGKTLTSWPSLQTDLKNAGATWIDKEVVVDAGIITSRKPDDIPAFNAAIIEAVSKGSATAGKPSSQSAGDEKLRKAS